MEPRSYYNRFNNQIQKNVSKLIDDSILPISFSAYIMLYQINKVLNNWQLFRTLLHPIPPHLPKQK